METVSFVALILLSLVGYSFGAVGKAGKSIRLKPQIIDLVLISIIWTGAVYSKIVLDLNSGLVILAWIILGGLIGILAVWNRKLPEEKASSKEESKETSSNLPKRLWRRWEDFSKRIGDFQSRMFLSLFFFVLVSPFALVVKMFSDPLKIRWRGNESHWLPRRTKTEISLDRFRRQF